MFSFIVGVNILVPGRQDPLNLTVHILCSSFDLPARALVQNFNQFNGAFGCGFCEQPGRSFQTEKGGTVRVFPYSLPFGPVRTKDSSIRHAKEAIKEHKVVRILLHAICVYVLIITAHVGRLFHLDRYNTLPIQLQVNGVKGPSWLSCLRSFNFINGMSVEYMHCALLGVSKLLLSLWTDSARCSNTIHDIRHAIQQLDNRMNRIKVTSSIRRKPRGISDLKHWKG